MKCYSASRTWSFYSVVAEIKEQVRGWSIAWRVSQRDMQKVFFWRKKSYTSEQQLPHASSNREFRINQVVFSSTGHKFSDLENGSACDSLIESTVL